MSIPVYKNLIAGEWVASHSGKTFLNINPARNTDVVGEFPSSNARDVDDAVAAAKKAYASWRLFPAPKRAEILYRAGEILYPAQGKVRSRHDPRNGQSA